MTYNLYADVILANNFTMDFLLLSVVRKVMKLEKRKGGIFLASLAGAVYALAVMIVPFPIFFLQFFATYAVMSALMVFIAFRLRRPGEILRAVAGLYLAAVMAAGLLQMFESLGGSRSSLLFYAAAASGSIWMTLVLWRAVSKGASDNGHLYRVTVYYRGKSGCFTGFLDTGNRLTEPASGKPVSILSADSGRELFRTVDGVLYIPFRTVGKESGVIPAVRAERMEIREDGRKTVFENPWIALSKEPLSQDGTYQMLLNEKLWL